MASITDPRIDTTTHAVEQPDGLSRSPRAKHLVIPWFFVFLAATLLYALTANRGTQWQDSGAHMVRVLQKNPISPLGLALSHPLHHWLARVSVATVGQWIEPAYAITLISGLVAAIAVANVFGIVFQLAASRAAALFAACSLAIAHTFWQLATITETYTLTSALLSAEVWCIVTYARGNRSRFLLLAFLFNGLSVANHMLAALTTPVLIVLVLHAAIKRRAGVREIFAVPLLWLLGASPYLLLVVTEIRHSGAVGETVQSALFGKVFGNQVLNTSVSTTMLARIFAFIILNFPSLCLPFAAIGIFKAKRIGVPPLAIHALRAMLAIHFLFAIRYSVIDQHTFMLPTYVLVCVFAGLGYACLNKFASRNVRSWHAIAWCLIAATPILYAFTPALARRFHVLDGLERDKPYRDDYVYLFTPWSVAERSADRMARHAMQLAGDRGIIVVEERLDVPAIKYHAIQAGRSNVTITQELSSDLVNSAAASPRPIVLVPHRVHAPRTPAPFGVWRRDGDLYVLQNP